MFLHSFDTAPQCSCLQLSALIASEWYMRNEFFPGWARPYEFAAELLAGQKRDEEARDMAR